MIFRQERVGLYGRPFTLLKFRTLRADAHEAATRWTVAGDRGMSPVGSFLRKSSLDELPQLWNVVRGDMALVGPRPERPFFVAKFSTVHPGYEARHRMPVGITGLAQINGLRGDTSIEDRARFDNHYIDTWSLWQDLWILARTAASFFRFRLGAADESRPTGPVGPARRAGSAAPHWPLLPLAATVLFLLAPLPAGDATASGKVGPADAASLLLVLVCAVQALRSRVRELTPLGVLVLGAPAVGLAVATMTAGDPYAALPGFVRYLQVFVLVPAAVVLLVRDAAEFRLAAGCFVVLALVQGAVGVVQYATHTGASYQGEDVRAVGTFGPGDVMGMATVVAYGLIVATAAGLAPGLPRRLRRIAGGCALVLMLPLVLSFSRGAWIATFGAAVLVMALVGIRRALKVVAALAAAGGPWSAASGSVRRWSPSGSPPSPRSPAPPTSR